MPPLGRVAGRSRQTPHDVVKKRGRWKSDSSIARCETSGRLTQIQSDFNKSQRADFDPSESDLAEIIFGQHRVEAIPRPSLMTTASSRSLFRWKTRDLFSHTKDGWRESSTHKGGWESSTTQRRKTAHPEEGRAQAAHKKEGEAAPSNMERRGKQHRSKEWREAAPMPKMEGFTLSCLTFLYSDLVQFDLTWNGSTTPRLRRKTVPHNNMKGNPKGIRRQRCHPKGRK